MKIGFDAKRAFYNTTGLGNYSRNIIQYLNQFYPKNEYLFFSPKIKNSINFPNKNKSTIIKPENFFSKKFQTLWRSFFIKNDIKKNNLDIFHGLSNEIPFGLQKIKTKTIVTIHDLIFIRYPKLYKPIDRYIYNQKFKYSCKKANKIIAISEQTKTDIIEFYSIDKEKITVVYQGCSPIFYKKIKDEDKNRIRKKYNLPRSYILSVGTIEERKNIFAAIKAIAKGKIEVPFVIVGKATNYIYKLHEFIKSNNLTKQIKFIHNVDFIDLPAIYQMAKIFIYPSIFEGFGIPIIEALNSGTPVITSKDGCFKEAGGDNSLYIEPYNIEEIANTLKTLLSDKNLQNLMIEKGYEFVQKFREDNVAKEIMAVYEEVMRIKS